MCLLWHIIVRHFLLSRLSCQSGGCVLFHNPNKSLEGERQSKKGREMQRVKREGQVTFELDSAWAWSQQNIAALKWPQLRNHGSKLTYKGLPPQERPTAAMRRTGPLKGSVVDWIYSPLVASCTHCRLKLQNLVLGILQCLRWCNFKLNSLLIDRPKT